MLHFGVSGTGDSVRFSLDGRGGAQVGGNGRLETLRGMALEMKIEGVDTLVPRLANAECSWSIANSSVSEFDADGLGLGVWKLFHKAPTKSLAQITYYEDPGLIGITVLMPDAVFDRAWRMFESIFTKSDFSYRLMLEGSVRNPMAKTENPTVDEFLSQTLEKKKAIITDEVSLSFFKSKSE